MLSLLAVVSLAAEPTLDVKAVLQVRERLEIDSGRDASWGGASWFVTQRARLGAEGSYGALSARLVVQDVRRWGEEGNTLGDYDANGFDLHEGWARWTHPNVAVTVGRQEWGVHEHRLIGNVEWASQARAFDGARIALKGGQGSGDLAVARLADPATPLHPEGGGVLAWGRGGWTGETGQIDGLAILDTDEASERLRSTLGVYAKGAAGPFSGRAEAYAQVGSVGDDSLVAWMAGARATWAPEAAWKPQVTLWYDHLSGDRDPDDGVRRAFDTLYATNHKFYGVMDVAAYRVGGATDGQGLHDAALKLHVAPHDRVEAHLDLHAFLAAHGPEIGEEVDLWAKVTVIEPLAVEIGGAAFRWPDGAVDGWGYLQIDARL